MVPSMSERRIRWKWIIVGGLLAEITVIAIFFLLLLAAMAAGVPEIAQPMATLALVDGVGVVKRIDSAFVLHGVLIAVFGILLFTVMWTATTGSLAQPALYVVAYGLKIVGGIAGGLIAEKRHGRALVA